MNMGNTNTNSYTYTTNNNIIWVIFMLYIDIRIHMVFNNLNFD